MKFDAGSFDPQQQKQQPKDVSPEEVAKIYGLDAVYSNKYYISIQPDGMVRITFADADPNEVTITPRFTVTMSASAYLVFANLIASNIQNVHRVLQYHMQQIQKMENALRPPALPMVNNSDTPKDNLQ